LLAGDCLLRRVAVDPLLGVAERCPLGVHALEGLDLLAEEVAVTPVLPPTPGACSSEHQRGRHGSQGCARALAALVGQPRDPDAFVRPEHHPLLRRVAGEQRETVRSHQRREVALVPVEVGGRRHEGHGQVQRVVKHPIQSRRRCVVAGQADDLRGAEGLESRILQQRAA